MVKKKKTDANMLSEVPEPKPREIRKPSLKEADFERVLDACDDGTLMGSRPLAMLLLLVSTGLRRGNWWSSCWTIWTGNGAGYW